MQETKRKIKMLERETLKKDPTYTEMRGIMSRLKMIQYRINDILNSAEERITDLEITLVETIQNEALQ